MSRAVLLLCVVVVLVIGGGVALLVLGEDPPAVPAAPGTERIARPPRVKPRPTVMPDEPAPAVDVALETRLALWTEALAHHEAGRPIEALEIVARIRKEAPDFLGPPDRKASVASMEKAALLSLQTALDGGKLVTSRDLATALQGLVSDPGRLAVVDEKLALTRQKLTVVRKQATRRILSRTRKGADRKTLKRHLDRFGPTADVRRTAAGDAVRPRLKEVAERNEKEPAETLPVPDIDEAEARRLEQLEKLRQRNAIGLLDHIAAGLAWLALHQGPDGGFSPKVAEARCRALGHSKCGSFGSKRREVAATALSVIAFLDFRDQDSQGLFEPALSRGVTWLMKRQQEDGALAKGQAHEVYAHAIAVMALGQAAAVSGRKDVRLAIERGIAWLASKPGPQGGYRYRLGPPGDLSATGWVAQSYEAAGLCGAKVPERFAEGLRQFWSAVWLGESSFSYLAAGKPSSSLTPVGMLMGHLLEVPSAKSMRATWRRTLARQSKRPRLYTLYYGVRVLLAMDGKLPKKWNDWVFELARQQTSKGAAAGSIPAKGRWELRETGLVTHTAFCVLTLEHSLYRR